MFVLLLLAGFAFSTALGYAFDRLNAFEREGVRASELPRVQSNARLFSAIATLSYLVAWLGSGLVFALIYVPHFEERPYASTFSWFVSVATSPQLVRGLFEVVTLASPALGGRSGLWLFKSRAPLRRIGIVRFSIFLAIQVATALLFFAPLVGHS